MHISYDSGESTDALYIEFLQSVKSDHVEGDWPFNVDVSSDKQVVGIEILDASAVFKLDFLRKHDYIPKQ